MHDNALPLKPVLLLVLGRQRQENPWGFLTRQCSHISDIYVNEKYSANETRMRTTEKDIPCQTLVSTCACIGIHACTLAYTCLYTHILMMLSYVHDKDIQEAYMFNKQETYRDDVNSSAKSSCESISVEL